MRHLVLAVTIVLYAAAVHCEEAKQPRVRREMRVLRLHGERARREWCGSSQQIHACTRFAAVTLDATTVQTEAGWGLKGNAGFMAFVALADTTLYGHEMNHVHDIEGAIDAYIVELERMSFTSREAAERAEEEAERTFRARVLAFAEASNFLRDGFAAH